jgi:hypothetical protein
MVAQKRSMRKGPHKITQRYSIISRAVFSGVMPLNSRRAARSIAAALFIFSNFLFSGAMRNKYNDKITRTTCTQWPAAAALLAAEIVGQFCGTTGKLYAVDFTRPLIGRF